jgi:hypothetical protein
MLSGAKKEDQEAMLAAQKQANETFAETKKAMTAPPRKEPTFDFSLPSMGGVASAPSNDPLPQIVTGFGGKPAPAQAPQPLI